MSAADAAVTVRKLAAGDAAAWRVLRLEALAAHPPAFGSSYEEEAGNDIAAFARGIPPAESPSALFGAFAGDRLCGSTGVGVSARLKQRHKGLVWGVYVAPDMRGRKIGERLLAAAIAHARLHVSVLQLTVEANNHAARELYRRAGFETYGLERRALRIGDAYHDNELMALYF